MDIGQVVRKTDFLFESVRFVADGLTLLVFSQVESSEIPLLIVSGFEPSNHGMMVGLLNNVLISPFSVMGIKNLEWFIIFFWRIIVVT